MGTGRERGEREGGRSVWGRELAREAQE